MAPSAMARACLVLVFIEGIRAGSGGSGGGTGAGELGSQCRSHADASSMLQVREARRGARGPTLPHRIPVRGVNCAECAPNGSIVSLRGGRVAHVTMPDGSRVEGDADRKPVEPAPNGWYGGWKTHVITSKYADAITRFSADFEVPEKPAANPGATTTYVFPGLEDADNAWILQPVLQWGQSACGPSQADQWTYQSYMVPSEDGLCSHASSSLNVEVGQKLRGEMELMPDGQWRVTSTVLQTGASTTLLIAGAKPQLTADLTIELYATDQTKVCDAYPGSPVAFSNIQLSTTAGPVNFDDIPWQKNDDPACMGHVEVTNDGVVTLDQGGCPVNSTTTCPGSSETCSGSTCCSGRSASETYQCPSADPQFKGCDIPMKMDDCTGFTCGHACDKFHSPYDQWNTYACFCAECAGQYQWECKNGTDTRMVDLNCNLVTGATGCASA